MANMSFTNNAATTLASGITNVATSLTVATGTGALFPTLTGSQYFYCTLINAAGTTIEIVLVTARSTDTFTIVRAQEGTTASAFNGGDQVQLRITAGEMYQAVNSGASVAGGAILQNTTSIASSYTFVSGTNGISVGPISISAGASVTVPAGQRWVIL